MFSRLVLLAGLILLSMDAFAAWPSLDSAPKVHKTGQKDVALLIGVEDYLLLPDVDGAVTNINEWEVFLRQGLGASAIHVVVNNDATREGILKSAKMAAEEASAEGTLWVVFVGHGAPVVDGSGVLVGVDAQQTIESLQARGVAQAELFGALKSKSVFASQESRAMFMVSTIAQPARLLKP